MHCKEIKIPGNERWEIICPDYSGIIKKAASVVYGAVRKDVNYEINILKETENKNCNLVVIAKKDDPLVKELLGESPKEDGYIVKVMESPYNKENKIAVITGYSDIEILYAAEDFADDYKALTHQNDNVPDFQTFSCSAYPDYYVNTVPFVKRRGIWTWGNCIYDYKKFFEHMARIKLNRITIWNDYVPINMPDVIEYAHSLGISVILGFSWGWRASNDTTYKIDISDKNEVVKWSDTVYENYVKNYSHLDLDGIYFQTFTETDKSTKDGVNIAEAAVNWVNTIGQRLLDAFPDLEIQFGLHATSVKNDLDKIKNVDKRISIIWEDCGDFPWHYAGYIHEGKEETEEFTRKIANLRENAPTGGVLKGQICLNWAIFEHYTGASLLGEKEQMIEDNFRYSENILRQNQSFWLKHADDVRSIIKIMGPDADISDLFEDGLLEKQIWFSIALYAQMLWDDKSATNELIQKVAARDNVVFA